MVTPQIFRRTDVMALAQPVVDAVASAPGGQDFDSLIDFIERFATQFERVLGVIRGIQENHAQESGQGEGDDSPATDRGAGNSPVAAPNVPPIMIYQRVLGLLAKMPEETTAGQMLALARGNKAMVLAQLATLLGEMSDDNPGQ